MTEQNYSSDAGSTASDAARRRQLIVLALVVAVAAIGAIGYFGFLKGGKSSNSAALPAIPHKSHVASPSAAPSSAGATVVPAVYQAPPANNPFKPLVQPPPPTAAITNPAAPSVSPTPTVVTPSPTVVTPTPTPTKASPTPTVTVTATPSPTSLPTAGQSITLTLVSVDSTAGTADVTVKQGTTTTPYNGLKPGQVFGTYFKLVSILSSDPSTPPVTYGADFEYGDQFVQLATGEWSQF